MKDDLNDNICHANCQMDIYMTSYLRQKCKNQLKWEIVALKVFILPYDNISSIMMNKGAMAKYRQVEILYQALPRDLKAEVANLFEIDSRDPSTFLYGKFKRHLLTTCVTTDAFTLLDLEGAHMALVVSSYSGPACILLPHVTVVAYIQTISFNASPVPE